MEEKAYKLPLYWKMLGLAAPVGVIAGLIAVLGFGWQTLLATMVLVLGAHTARSLTHTHWRERRALLPAPESCHHCGSLQVDHRTSHDVHGQEVLTPHCFACDRDLEDHRKLA